MPVTFVNVDLQIYGNDSKETPYSWNMDIGLIDPRYQSSQYFDFYKENMLGLAPSSTDVPSELARQFIYQFVTTGNHNMDLAESYAFNGGESFTIGGTLDDYKELICAGGAADELFGNVTIKPVVIEGVFAEYNANEARTHPTYWKSKTVNPKVANYAPPMEQELLE